MPCFRAFRRALASSHSNVSTADYWYPVVTPRSWLRTPRGRPARVALHAGAVAHQREVAAFAAGLALVALGAGLGALLGGRRLGLVLRVRPVERVERGCGLCFFGFERGGAGGVERGDVGAS